MSYYLAQKNRAHAVNVNIKLTEMLLGLVVIIIWRNMQDKICKLCKRTKSLQYEGSVTIIN